MTTWTALLLGGSLALSGAMIFVSSVRSLSPLENALFQVLILGAGLGGSYLFGRQSARAAAEELVKPAARSAFRRVLWLYSSLSRMADKLRVLTDGSRSPTPELQVVEALVGEQLASVIDAMEDWRDLVPEEVADVEKRLRANAGREVSEHVE